MQHLAKLTGIEELLNRYPHELSGGQQQRVALARALAPAPKLLLLDEPFSNLDADLRAGLSADVRAIPKQEGVTAIMVTHDHTEAFGFADRVALMEDGQIAQLGTAHQIYNQPATPFVAEFLGLGRWITGIKQTGARAWTCFGDIAIDSRQSCSEGSSVQLMVRAENVVMDDSSQVSGTVTQRTFRGSRILYRLQIDARSEVLALLTSTHRYQVGETFGIRLNGDPLPCFNNSV